MNKCKGKHDCKNCGQYIFEDDVEWIIKRFEKIEKKAESTFKVIQTLKDILRRKGQW